MHFFLFVSGNPRSGKNTLATIAENYNFTILDASKVLSDIFRYQTFLQDYQYLPPAAIEVQKEAFRTGIVRVGEEYDRLLPALLTSGLKEGRYLIPSVKDESQLNHYLAWIVAEYPCVKSLTLRLVNSHTKRDVRKPFNHPQAIIVNKYGKELEFRESCNKFFNDVSKRLALRGF
jgi:hypothetical protein